jgi:hypothetical protein
VWRLDAANPGHRYAPVIGTWLVNVNNVLYQTMLDLRPDTGRDNPQKFPPEQRGLSQYDLPLLLHPNPRRMLIVGAGAGNDAAGGLRQGIPEIVAVEIDPAIIELGKEFHPEQPYGPAVELVNDDARSYFAAAPEQSFDVISFGLLDSHTTTAMTNARLDHYVYTRESLQRARQLLRDGGIMTLTFEAQKPFIADRMAGVLREVFGKEPVCFHIPYNGYGWGGTMFVTGDDPALIRKQIDGSDRLREVIGRWQQTDPVPLPGTTHIATDDWPYIYLEEPRIPPLFLLLALLMAGLFAWGCYRQGGGGRLLAGWDRSSWHFFFLGAAFLLLEVQNISKAAVVLGNTWGINAVIISAILGLILLANLIAAWRPQLHLLPVYLLLGATCLGLYLVDLSRFAFLPYATRCLVVGLLTSLPMLFSGIIFIRSFASVPGKDTALGANLLGALVGGLLQTITFLTGIKFLLLLVAGLYLAAFLCRPQDTAKAVSLPEPAGADPLEAPGAAAAR